MVFKANFLDSQTGNYSIASPFWRSFLRMQFALEASKKNNRRPHIEFRDQNDREAIVENIMLELLKEYEQLYKSKKKMINKVFVFTFITIAFTFVFIALQSWQFR